MIRVAENVGEDEDEGSSSRAVEVTRLMKSGLDRSRRGMVDERRASAGRACCYQ